jgi:hypothetical protein
MNQIWTTGEIVATTSHDKTSRSDKGANACMTEIPSIPIPGRTNPASHHIAGEPG